jgi:Zn-dependent peptidase ImmA (M78 family)
VGARPAGDPNRSEIIMKRKYVEVGKRIYSHNSVGRLIECHQHISQDPEEIIRNLVRNRLTEAKDLGWSGPPFNPQFLASMMGIQCEESRELVYSEDAELHSTLTGLIIKYNPDKPKTRQNFSIAHEISHTLFPGYKDQYKARHKIGRFDPSSEVEFLCDIGASEIILPAPEFDLDIHRTGVSLKSLEKLSKLYEVSREASAIRMITTNHYPCAMMVLDYSHKPAELSQIEQAKHQLNLFDDCSPGLPPMKLRVQFCIRSKQFSTFIPKDKSIDESSPLYKVSVTQEAFQGNFVLDLEERGIEFYAEAMALPGIHNLGSRVLAILFQH